MPRSKPKRDSRSLSSEWWEDLETHITILIETETNISLEAKGMRGNVNTTENQDNKEVNDKIEIEEE